MEKGKSKMFVVFLKGIFFGFLLCLVAVFLYFNAPAYKQMPKEVSLDQVLARIENKEIKEVYFKQSQVELFDKSGNKFFAILGSDATRESLIQYISDFNGKNTASSIKYNEEPQSSGLYWIIAIQMIPFVFLFGILVFLIVIYNNHIKRKVEK